MATQLNPALNQRGFTLTELVVTVAIVGIVATVASLSLKTSKSYAVRESSDNVGALASGIRRYIVNSNASAVDAITAGLQPDVRGRLVVVMRSCSTIPSNIRTQTLGFPCTHRQGNFYKFTYEALTAGGGFEVKYTTYVPDTSSGLWRQYVIALPSADITQGRLGHSSNGKSAVSGSLTITNPTSLGGVQLTTSNEHKIYCYANATCDPVTYYFCSVKYGEPPSYYLSRLAVTPTGSIFKVYSW